MLVMIDVCFIVLRSLLRHDGVPHILGSFWTTELFIWYLNAVALKHTRFLGLYTFFLSGFENFHKRFIRYLRWLGCALYIKYLRHLLVLEHNVFSLG